MFTVDVKIDARATINMLNQLRERMGDQAVASAVNKTMAQAKTMMQRAIVQEFNISAATVRERLVLKRASASKQVYTATLIGNPRGRSKPGMNVIHFLERKVTLAEARRRRKGGTLSQLRFKIKRAGGFKTIKGAFIGNQGRTVFRRVGIDRLPIEAVTTIGVPGMFQTKRIQIPIQQWIKANFPRILEREAAYFLSTLK